VTKPTDPADRSEKPDEGAFDTPVASRGLSTMVAVDFEGTDHPERCDWCPDWRFAWVDLKEGHTVLREWHLPTCSVVTDWEETDPEALKIPIDPDEL